MRETKNSTNVTHNVILRSKKFDRIGLGEYRLEEKSPVVRPQDFETARTICSSDLNLFNRKWPRPGNLWVTFGLSAEVN